MTNIPTVTAPTNYPKVTTNLPNLTTPSPSNIPKVTTPTNVTTPTKVTTPKATIRRMPRVMMEVLRKGVTRQLDAWGVC
jgi:hypothetical protein